MEDRLAALEQALRDTQAEVQRQAARGAAAEQALAATTVQLQQQQQQQQPQHVHRAQLVDTKVMNKPKSFSGVQSEWGEWSFVFRAYVAAIDPRLRDVVERSAASAHPLAVPADTSADRQLGAQLYYLLALMTSDKALAVVRNVEEGHGMESWRRLASTYEPRTGMRFGALLQLLLRYQIGAGDDTELAHEIDKFEHDVRKYEDQSGEKLSNTIKHSILCS
eukprot:6466041-Amphidinium_carterae.1